MTVKKKKFEENAHFWAMSNALDFFKQIGFMQRPETITEYAEVFRKYVTAGELPKIQKPTSKKKG